MSNVKPMLAVDYEKLKTPLTSEDYLYQPKLDGIRMLVKDDICYTRTGKLVPNKRIQERFSKYNGYDGELYSHYLTFNEITSIVLSKDADIDALKYHVYDFHSHPAPFKTRNEKLFNLEVANFDPYLEAHAASAVVDFDLHLEELVESQGYEGVIFRHREGLYKHGRSGLKVTGSQPELVKYKKFMDAEARIVSVDPRQEFVGEHTISPLGYSERDTRKDSLMYVDEVGSLVVSNDKGEVFGVGSGFTKQQRIELWAKRDELIGKVITYRYFETDSYDKPRFPTFKSFRDGF
jgi:ATP-dependent DNA ligase